MKNVWYKYLYLILLLQFVYSCNAVEKEESKTVVSIGQSKLLESDLEIMGLEMDKSLNTQNYISKWAKDQLMLEIASQLSTEKIDVDIEDLVNKYRNNLLSAHYEKYLIESQLDTSISEKELLSYYENHKEEFKLDHKIVKCRFIHVAKSKDDKKEIRVLIKSKKRSDKLKLQKYCNDEALYCLLPFDKWYSWKEIKANFPSGIRLNKRDIGKSVRTNNKKDVFYIYLLDYLSYKDDAPFTYIKSQAKQSILFHRSRKIIEDKKEELYNNALKDNRIKIF